MAGVNSTAICFDDASLQQCSSSIRCSHESVSAFQNTMGGTLWRVNMLVLTDAVLAGVIVAISAFAQRYRHHPFTRFIFLGATTLLLPITSYVVSTISTNSNDYVNNKHLATLAASCRGGFHYFTAVSWAFLIQITMINTSVIVAVDDREGRNRGPPIQLLFQGLWTVYLGVYAMGPIMNDIWQLYLELMLFAIICAKVVLKYYAYVKARKSFAFGRNPCLISGNMEKLQKEIQPNGPVVGEDPPLLVMGEQDHQQEEIPLLVMGEQDQPQEEIQPNGPLVGEDNPLSVMGEQDELQEGIQINGPLVGDNHPTPLLAMGEQDQLQEPIQTSGPLEGEDPPPPPFLVMGEQDNNVKIGPHGYFINNKIGLVTFDMVWKFNDDDVFPSMPQLKDLCLSFSLFKLLRCRFARYEHANDRSVGTNFFWNFLLTDGNHERAHNERVFQVIADEISFIRDYYFSSLPVSYLKYWLPIFSVSISLLSITYCILATRFIIMGHTSNWKTKYSHQLRCHFWCNERHLMSDRQDKNFGSFLFDDISLFFLIAIVFVAEAVYIASYIFSNWTKVALTCHYINHVAFQHSLCIRKSFGFLLRCKWKHMKHWDEKMGQSSVLVVHPRTTPLGLLRRLLRLPDLDRSVDVKNVVKASIIDILRCYKHEWHRLGKGTESLRNSTVGRRFLEFCNSNSTDTILTWHIATCILELDRPAHQDGQKQGVRLNLNHKVIATNLSRYCTYLMAWSPDLLPDDDEWSKSQYESVKKDAKRALVALASGSEYEQVVRLLSDNSVTNTILRNGVTLAEQLVAELTEGEAWMILAKFWSEMILYITPSENVRGHLGAIARGGELITLLWALLTHAGIMRWPADTGGDDIV